MKVIKSMSINGRNVKECKIEGGWIMNKQYEELEMVELNKAQWFDTGLTFNQDTRLECSLYCDSTKMNNTAGVYVGTAFNNIRICFAKGASGNTYQYVAFGTSKNYKWITNNDIYGLHDVTICNGLAIVDGIQYTMPTAEPFQSTDTIQIFNSTPGIFYRLKVWGDDILVSDIVPVRRLNDNSVGVYDKVREMFIIHQGGGALAAGEPTGIYY